MARKKAPVREPTPAEEDGDAPLSPEEQEALDNERAMDDPPPGAGEDARLRRAADGQRRTRAADSDSREDAGLAAARDRSFRDEFTHEALPKPPNLPGFHCCWLSSTNQWDPIPRRVRMGYTPVTPDEAPDLQGLTQKSGQWEGMIGINEMLLYKIPLDIWHQMMKEFHHDGPRDEEAGIKNRTDAMSQEMQDSEGTSLVRMEGDMASLGRAPRRKPGFEE